MKHNHKIDKLTKVDIKLNKLMIYPEKSNARPSNPRIGYPMLCKPKTDIHTHIRLNIHTYRQ